MGPRPKPAPQPSPVVLDPADPRWADLVASFDELERGGGVTLTAEEAEHYFETGDLPKRDVTVRVPRLGIGYVRGAARLVKSPATRAKVSACVRALMNAPELPGPADVGE
jgi:hypothetical protein